MNFKSVLMISIVSFSCFGMDGGKDAQAAQREAAKKKIIALGKVKSWEQVLAKAGRQTDDCPLGMGEGKVIPSPRGRCEVPTN